MPESPTSAVRQVALCSPVPPDPCGPEVARVAAATARALAARGHGVRVVEALPDTGALRGCDVAHVLGWGGLGPDAVRRAAASVPVVLSLSDDALDRHGRPRAALAAEVAAAAAVVVPSLAQLVRLREHLRLEAARVRLVPPGQGLALPARRRRPTPYSGRGPLTVLHLGPLGEAAGTLDLLAAVAHLEPGAVRLLACGELPGPVPQGVTVLPRPRDRGLAELAADCHLAALPAHGPESYALALDEAIALGLPAWVTCGGVAAERYDRGAFEALPARDPDAWASALEALLGAPRRSREAFQALPRAAPTAAGAAVTLEAIYADVIASRAPSDPAPPRSHARGAATTTSGP